jgi:AraC-like DNA-binding protein
LSTQSFHQSPAETGSSAQVSASGARAAYVGPGMNLSPHRNAAATLAFGLEDRFILSMPIGAPEVDCNWAFIPPGTLHQVRSSSPMAFVYLDARSDDLALLARSDMASAHARILKAHSEARLELGVDQLCECLGAPRRAAGDPRMAEILRMMDADPDAFVGLTAAARRAGLSTSRFHELFRVAAGMPFRRYRLWRRMSVVVRVLAQGGSLTAAAMEAGFASSAHLSASFRDMFGIAPSHLLAAGVRFRHEEGASAESHFTQSRLP